LSSQWRLHWLLCADNDCCAFWLECLESSMKSSRQAKFLVLVKFLVLEGCVDLESVGVHPCRTWHDQFPCPVTKGLCAVACRPKQTKTVRRNGASRGGPLLAPLHPSHQPPRRLLASWAAASCSLTSRERSQRNLDAPAGRCSAGSRWRTTEWWRPPLRSS
jgi:hypothetical protein